MATDTFATLAARLGVKGTTRKPSHSWQVTFGGVRLGIYPATSAKNAIAQATEYFRAQGQTLEQAAAGLPRDGTGLRAERIKPRRPLSLREKLGTAGLTYSEQHGWRGADSHSLYLLTDKRTGATQVRDGGSFHGIGPEVSIRLATADEARAAGWPAGWTVA